MTLTPRQRAVLTAVAEHTRTKGYSPSLRDIGAAVGLSSTNAVAYQLWRLVAAGLLAPTLPNQPRTTSLAAGVAVSRNGLVARAVTVAHCPACDLSLPEDHCCTSPEGGAVNEPTFQVAARYLARLDLIVVNPMDEEQAVEWVVSDAKAVRGEVGTKDKVDLTYTAEDGTEHTHTFEDADQDVTLRLHQVEVGEAA